MVLILSHIHYLTMSVFQHILTTPQVLEFQQQDHQLAMSFSSLNLLVAQPYMPKGILLVLRTCKHNFIIIVKMIIKIKSFCLNYIENTFGNDQLFLSDKV